MTHPVLLAVRAVLLLDLAAGLAWWWGHPRRSMTPAYEPIRMLLDPLPADPARAWGSVLVYIACAGLAVFAFRNGHRFARMVALALGAGYWLTWVGCFLVAAVTRGDAGIAPVFLATSFVVLHVVPIMVVDLDDEDKHGAAPRCS